MAQRPEYAIRAEKKYAEKRKKEKCRFCIYFQKDYGEDIKQVAKNMNIPVSELIKLSLDEYLENHHL